MGWIKIKDKLPNEGQKVWYYFEYTGVDLGWYTQTKFPEEVVRKKHIYGNQFYNDGGFLTDDVSHWMPLEIPDPPEGK